MVLLDWLKSLVGSKLSSTSHKETGSMDKTLTQLLADLQAVIEGLQAQLGDVPAALAKVRQEGYDAGKADGDAAGYARGFADGKNSVDQSKIYTQADLDAAVSGAVAPLQSQIDQLNQQVAALQAGMQDQINAAVAKAVADKTAEFVSTLQALKAQEDADVDAMIAKYQTPPAQ